MTDAARAREQELLNDPDAEIIDPFWIFCRVCSIRLKLSDKSAYDLSHWRSHKAKSNDHNNLKRLGKKAVASSEMFPNGGRIVGSNARSRVVKKSTPAPDCFSLDFRKQFTILRNICSAPLSTSPEGKRTSRSVSSSSGYIPSSETKTRRSSRNATLNLDHRDSSTSLAGLSVSTYVNRSNHRSISPANSLSASSSSSSAFSSSSLTSLSGSEDSFGSDTSSTSYAETVVSPPKSKSTGRPPKFRRTDEPDYREYLHSICGDVDKEASLEDGTVVCWKKWSWKRLHNSKSLDESGLVPVSPTVLSKEEYVAGLIDVEVTSPRPKTDERPLECAARVDPLPEAGVGHMFCENPPSFGSSFAV
ncbi:hypothetical protein VNI00_000801 [Paramarasmius palmivorus]|uniref:Uncharacterized protein n=1 Tax=Paramarasmius palmivorus TaxID=297713 RepID=A0AAW0E690_9AGAR